LGPVVIGDADACGKVKAGLLAAAKEIVVGNGLEAGVTMGPVISAKAKDRILGCIQKVVDEGAKLLLDGRKIEVKGLPGGNWVGPTIFEDVKPSMSIVTEELFGRVVCLMKANDLDQSVSQVNTSEFGNACSIYTSRGK